MNKIEEILYGTDDPKKIIEKKTTEKQIRAFTTTIGKVEITADECRKLLKKIGIEYQDGYESRVRQYRITDESADRYGDIVRAKGVQLKNYIENPVVQFAHDYAMPPIGNAVKTWYEKDHNAVISWAFFFDDRIDISGRSNLIFRFIEANAMRGSSIGFRPIDAYVPKSAEEEADLGLGKYGIDYRKVDLLEWSAVPVPANPNALKDDYREAWAKSIQNGHFTRGDVDLLRKFPVVQDDVIDLFIKELDSGKYVLGSDITAESNRKDVDAQSEEAQVILRPYPSEHACRLKTPTKYEEFRRGTRKHGDKVYSVIYGKVKDSDIWEEQAYRYLNTKWSAEEARAHCEEHNAQLFEPAVEASWSGVSTNLGFTMTGSGSSYYFSPPAAQPQTLSIDLTQIQEMLSEMKNIHEEIKATHTEIKERFAGLESTAQRALADKSIVEPEIDLYDVLGVKKR